MVRNYDLIDEQRPLRETKEADGLILLTCLQGVHLLPHLLDSFKHELEPFAAILGAHDYFLDRAEHMRIAGLFPEVLQKRMNLRQHDEHFSAYCGLEE